MPPLAPTKRIGHAKFASHRLKLPPDSTWQQPQGEPAAPHYRDAILPHEKVAIPKVFPPFFTPQNQHVYHQDSCNVIGQFCKDFHDTAIDAVQYAHDRWRFEVGFTGLAITGSHATAGPTCLFSQPIKNLIKSYPSFMSMVGNEAAYRDAVVKGVGSCFQLWQENVTVPALPWYPSFSAYPSPVATPLPNIPVPLVACISTELRQITDPRYMKDAMIGSLSAPVRDADVAGLHVALFDAIATVLATAFGAWVTAQPVAMVMGTGAVPTYAPPYVPAGPVIGTTLPGSGTHLIT